MKNLDELQQLQSIIDHELPYPATDDQKQAWLNALGQQINFLIIHDFDKLVSVLYHLDIDELKLRQVLDDSPGVEATNTGKLIAALMFERQIQKIKTRQEHRHNDNNTRQTDNNEKW